MVADWDGMGGKARQKGDEGSENLLYTRVHVVARRGGTSGFRVLFLRSKAAYTAQQNRQTTENVFYFLKRDVWRQFYCAFHSVGRFEIQARILFVLEQRGDKAGDGRREGWQGERVGGVTRGEEGGIRRETLCIGVGRITRGEKVF